MPHEDLRSLTAIEHEADELYGKWRSAMERFGARDDYWARVVELSEDFADRHGDYGQHVIVARAQLLERKWRDYKGIVYSGTIEDTLGTGEHEYKGEN